MNKHIVKAIHDDDLEKLLENLGLLSEFINGKLSCFSCNDIIGQQNLHSIFPDGGTIKLCCNKPNCISKLIEKREAIKN